MQHMNTTILNASSQKKKKKKTWHLWLHWTMTQKEKKRKEPFMSLIQVAEGHRTSVHISCRLPQDSQIISPPWHCTCSTALGCLTVRDIDSACVYCMCVCTRTCVCCPNLKPSAPPADCDPSGAPAIQVSCLSVVNTLCDTEDKHKLHPQKFTVDTGECIATTNSAPGPYFIFSACSCVDCKLVFPVHTDNEMCFIVLWGGLRYLLTVTDT